MRRHRTVAQRQQFLRLLAKNWRQSRQTCRAWSVTGAKPGEIARTSTIQIKKTFVLKACQKA
jgi:hypothetical protein